MGKHLVCLVLRLCGLLITRITTNVGSDLCLLLYECLGKDLIEENLDK